MKILFRNQISIHSLLILTTGIFYFITVIYALLTLDPITHEITSVSKLLMEILTIFSSLFLLLFTVSFFSKYGWNYDGVLASMFMGLSFLTTLVVHFSSIVLTRSSLISNDIYSSLLSFSWPSIFYNLDIIAWDILFGLSFIYSGKFVRKNYDKLIGNLMIVAGLLSLIGIIAIPMNNINLRFIGVFGYVVIPIVVCILVIKHEAKACK